MGITENTPMGFNPIFPIFYKFLKILYALYALYVLGRNPYCLVAFSRIQCLHTVRCHCMRH